MPTFNANVPQALQPLDAGPICDNFNALNDKIDALPAPPTLVSELVNDAGYITNPGSIDLANRWLQDTHGNTVFEWGNEQNTVVIAGTVLAAGEQHKSANFNQRILAFGQDGSGVIQPAIAWGPGGPLLYSEGADVVYLSVNADARQLVASDGVTVAATWADGTLRDGTGTPFSTGAYTPANPGHWSGTPPATVAEALDRLAAAVSNHGATPV